MSDDNEMRWGKRRRPGQQARARVVSPPRRPELTLEQQQAAARAQWNVELILENYRAEREGNRK